MEVIWNFYGHCSRMAALVAEASLEVVVEKEVISGLHRLSLRLQTSLQVVPAGHDYWVVTIPIFPIDLDWVVIFPIFPIVLA